MKRILDSQLLVLLALAQVWLLAACGTEEKNAPSNARIELPDLPNPLVDKESEKGPVRDAREFRIALTGGIRGELQPCGCPTLPYGGFARRYLFLESLSGEGFPLFQLDAGEAALKGVSQQGRRDGADRAEVVFSLMKEVGVDAMTLGPSDLMAFSVLENFRPDPDAMPPLLSGGWQSMEESLLPSSRDAVVLEREGIRLAVVGLSGAAAVGEVSQKYRRKTGVDFVQNAFDALSQEVDLKVVLGSLSQEEALELARAVPDLALILRSDDNPAEAPVFHSGTLIVETPPRGRYVTTLRIRLGSDPKTPLLLEGKEAKLYEAVLNRREHALGLTEENLTEQKRASLAQAEEELAEGAEGLNLVRIENRPLGSRFTGQTPLDSTLESFLETWIEKAQETAESTLEPDSSTAEEGSAYATPATCVSCHVQEFAQWAYTGHKDAAVHLAAQGDHRNPECLSCHSTGFGEPGGFGDPTPFNLGRLGGVQCEACHGPLKGHPEEEAVTPRPITESVCVSCHDEANSPNFDYESYRARIHCNRG